MLKLLLLLVFVLAVVGQPVAQQSWPPNTSTCVQIHAYATSLTDSNLNDTIALGFQFSVPTGQTWYGLVGCCGTNVPFRNLTRVVLPAQTSVTGVAFVFSLYSGHLLSEAPYNITAPILLSNAITKTSSSTQYVQNISLPTDQLPPLSAGTYYFAFWAAGGSVAWFACANQTSQLYGYCGLNQQIGGGSVGQCNVPNISPSATWVTLLTSTTILTALEASYEYACFPCSFSLLLFRLYANVQTTGATTNPTTTSNTTPSPTTSSQTSSNSSSSDASCVASFFWLLWVARLLGSF